jgi:hypothetical protein
LGDPIVCRSVTLLASPPRLISMKPLVRSMVDPIEVAPFSLSSSVVNLEVGLPGSSQPVATSMAELNVGDYLPAGD